MGGRHRWALGWQKRTKRLLETANGGEWARRRKRKQGANWLLLGREGMPLRDWEGPEWRGLEEAYREVVERWVE